MYCLHFELGFFFSSSKKMEMKVCLGERRGILALMIAWQKGFFFAISNVIIYDFGM